MKIWVLDFLLVAFVVGLVILGWYATQCTAPVNINIKAEAYQCQTEIENQDGSVNFHGCQKTDGASPVDQEAIDGPDNIQGGMPSPGHARLN